jgi:hypothetical protein
MAQQTAVEWLQSEWQKHDMDISIRDLWKQAKAMEKEQIKNAYWNGTTDMEKADALFMAEQFYNEYYGKKN